MMDLHPTDCRFEPHCQRSIFWYGLLATLSHQIACVASEHHGKSNGSFSQWIKITLWLLKIRRSLPVKSSGIFTGDV